MLAYELFRNNKISSIPDVKKQFPLKKIIYKNNNIAIDTKKLEEYSLKTMKGTEPLQNWLQMPLNTTDAKLINLPDFRIGAGSLNPYIEIYGNLKTNGAGESKLTLSIGKKPNHIEYILDLTNDEIKRNAGKKITLKLDTENYFINSNVLFSEYVNSGIIDENGILNIEVYDRIIQEFLEFTKERELSAAKYTNAPFRIYILPDITRIEFKKQTKEEIDDSNRIPFTDFFNNKSSEYPSTPTKTAKFLSYDDRAFTINCMQKADFYKNLGIGSDSLEKIFTDKSQTFSISRLDWTFINIFNSNFEFVETNKKGILIQLYENYRVLKDLGVSELSGYKVICVRVNQAKQELLIDENLTMNKMKKMFSNIKDVPPPPLCFEVLIDTSGQNPIWNTYLYVIKNFLAGNKIPKNYLLSYFNKKLRQKIYSWIKSKDRLEQRAFFDQSNFCLQCLCSANDTVKYMDGNEEFAEKIGQIANVYIDFKKKGENDNSLSDILTYSKYDREKLRFIVSRIGRGIQLSKRLDADKDAATNQIRSLQPEKEIEDDAATKDYSYFFFKGFYTNARLTVS